MAHRSPDRLHGVDAARGLALAGMFAVHLLPATDPDGTPTWAEEIGLGDVEAAFDRMHRGEVLRSVVLF